MRIEKKIFQLIDELTIIPGRVTRASHLYTDIRMDSLSFITLLLHIEEYFGISFHLYEMQECLVVDVLIALVEAKLKENEHAQMAFDG